MDRRAARVDHNHTCPLTTPAVHTGGPILLPAAPRTLINGKHAARVSDKARCNAPAPDTVRGGLITVFIEGSPASREADKTDVGLIVEGSPTVFLGEWGGGPLSPFQAQWLYDYLANERNIPYEYATDGCYVRADRMAQYIQALGIPVDKQWVHGTPASGPLNVPIAGYPGGGVTWRYHVAPVVEVAKPGGGSQPMVLDPSLGGGPVTVDDWIRKQNVNPRDTIQKRTPPNVWYDGYNPRTRTWGPPDMSNPARTAGKLDEFRRERAALPAASGRNIPNGPVHY